MSKILVVADIHLHDYTNRNPELNYRLHQGSRLVSENIINVGKANSCEYIVFAGDIIEKSIVRPYVQAEVKYFLDRIMSNFKEGWVIWGNHDQDNKSSDQEITDSLLGVILPYNLHYAHQKTMIMDNSLIAFSNWQPEFDLSWIQKKVDVLFTHARINYNVHNNAFTSQELDENKFDLAICGDIHSPAQLGKYVSIGVPQRCKMGDSEVSSGVVFDTITKSWEWVNLNPNDNLMKFIYTPNLEEDNLWNPETKTWLVYKRPDSDLVSGTVDSTKLPAWEEVNALIDQAIINNGLQDIHTEVLSCVPNYPSNEVDFNFTLTRLTCKNWRSIDECTVYFNEGDKILIQGSNGSGKSSLLSALKYAFVDVSDTKGLSSLKPFLQFGTKDCFTEVEFLYQGHKCCIRRGTKEYGLWINDEPMKYSDKKSFEADVRARFPFISYMDIFFLDAEHNQLIGGMSVEKKSLIISKFLKLDKLDLYNTIASNLYDNFKKANSEININIGKVQSVLAFITQQRNSLPPCPTVSREKLVESKNRGIELEKKSKLWSEYVNATSRYQAKIDLAMENISKLKEESKSFRDISVIDNEIANCNTEIQALQNQVVELGKVKTTLDFKTKEWNDLRNEGNKIWKEAQSIALNKKCSTCGQIILTSESLQNHKAELEKKVSEIGDKIKEIKIEITNLTELWNNSEETYNQINIKIGQFNQMISTLTLEKSNQNRVSKEIADYTKQYQDTVRLMSELGTPEKVELPDNFLSSMSSLDSQIKAWDDYARLDADLAAAEQDAANLKAESDRVTELMSKLELYLKLTGPAGDIYCAILTNLAEQFTDGQVRYEVIKYTNRGEHLNLESQFYNNGNWVDYAACSSGQKTVLDVNFLSKVVSRLGLLVMDEFLKHLDAENHDICIELITNMNVGCIMISSHMESIAAFNNKSCKLSLNASGLTQVDFK